MEMLDTPNTSAVSQAFKRFSQLTKPFIGNRWFRLQEWNSVSFHEEYSEYARTISDPFQNLAKTGTLITRATQGEAISLNALMKAHLLAEETVDMISRSAQNADPVSRLPAMNKDIRELNEQDARELASTFNDSTSFVLLAACIIQNKLEELGIPRASASPEKAPTHPRAHARYQPEEAELA